MNSNLHQTTEIWTQKAHIYCGHIIISIVTVLLRMISYDDLLSSMFKSWQTTSLVYHTTWKQNLTNEQNQCCRFLSHCWRKSSVCHQYLLQSTECLARVANNASEHSQTGKETVGLAGVSEMQQPCSKYSTFLAFFNFLKYSMCIQCHLTAARFCRRTKRLVTQ